MQNVKITPQNETVALSVSPSGRRGLPPINNFVDQLLDDLFNSERDTDVLTRFDYEAFLRREGLSC